MDRPVIIDKGTGVVFNCAKIEGSTTLTACEEFCPRHSHCDTVAMANDVLANDYSKGLIELIKSANCLNYAEFVNLLYDIGCLAGKETEMARIVEALDEIDSSPGY